MKRFDGKVAFIAGGTTGIGLGIARAFVAERARVVIVGRSREKGEAALSELRAMDGDVLFISADVTDAADVERAVAETVKSYGRLDCAINNAVNSQYNEDHLSTHEGSIEAYDRYMAVLVRSVWVGMKFQLQQMMKQGSGSIVNTSSVDALRCHSGGAGQAIYCAGKCAVIGLTRAVAKEYAKKGIRVNILCPGGFDTPLMDELYVGKSPKEAEELTAWLNAQVPMGRLGNTPEAAAAVLWLCSDEASYVTGHNMVVSGGMD
ncbi:MAG TPA: SDR family oxidoreductase [Pyrinomonadaceae bacterium]|nr:SDR family oxidoreductase [Pyrinomonadaceae bacterium]